MAITISQFKRICSYAEAGYRLQVSIPDGNGSFQDFKTVWGGLGNRSGLHGFADSLTAEKWQKSGPGFKKKILAYPPDTKIEVLEFRNKTRDRGVWRFLSTITVSNRPAPACYHLSINRFGDCETCGINLESE